jgi:CPA2 family monovalent cation:H+ antiporter-2
MGLLATLHAGSRPVALTVGGIAIFAVFAFAAAWLLPRALNALTNEPDLFLILSVSSGLVIAGLGARVFDIPIALAAFVAGLAVGESPTAVEARDRLRPFRDIFAVMFFVSIGTLIDPAGVPPALGWLGVVLGLVLATKVGVTFALAHVSGAPGVRAWQLAAGLGQVGEFSFVLGSLGLSEHVIPSEVHTALLAAVVITIVVSTLVVRLPGDREPLSSTA